MEARASKKLHSVDFGALVLQVLLGPGATRGSATQVSNLSVYLSVCLSVCLSACLSTTMRGCPKQAAHAVTKPTKMHCSACQLNVVSIATPTTLLMRNSAKIRKIYAVQESNDHLHLWMVDLTNFP